MKILSITAQKPHSTGSGTYLTELVRSWALMGHEQAVVCGIYPEDSVDFPDGVSCYPVFFTSTDPQGDTSPGHVSSDGSTSGTASPDALFAPCKLRDSGSYLRALPFPVTGMSDIMPYASTRYRDLTPSMISQFESAFIDAVGRAISDLDPDLIVCHHLFLLTALVRKHFPDRRTAGISHGTDLRQMLNCDNMRDAVRPHIQGLDIIFALHDEQKQQIMDIFDIPDDRIRVIGSGYNDRLFNSAGRHSRHEIRTIAGDMTIPVLICYAGKISRPKGVPELLAALRSIVSDPAMPDIEVTLAGGCQDEEVRRMLDDLPEGIRWIGQISQPHLADIMKTSDIFVLPSYFEGLPLVLIEAMASGAVPVSTDLPGIRPWIEANVPHHNVRFVPMPEMQTIDMPTQAGRECFARDLEDTLRELILELSGTGSSELPLAPAPDTSGITWKSVAERILTGAGCTLL